MFEKYREDWNSIVLSPEADESINQVIGAYAEQGRRPNRKLWKIVLAAALLCVLLAGGVFAVSGFNFSEIPETLRAFYGIENGVVPGYIFYEKVMVEEGSVYADVQHKGVGEIYPGADAIQTENLVVVSGNITTVTAEQHDNYVWRARLEGQEAFIPLEVAEEMHHNCLHFRFTVLKDECEIPKSLCITVFGGYESEDGKEFYVLRQGYMNVEIPAETQVKVIVPQTPVELWDEETGIGGELVKMEVYNDLLVLYYHIPGLDDMWERVDDNRNDPEALKWINAVMDMTRDAGFRTIFDSGEELGWLPMGPSVYEEGDILRESQMLPVLSDVVSITVWDTVYEIN